MSTTNKEELTVEGEKELKAAFIGFVHGVIEIQQERMRIKEMSDEEVLASDFDDVLSVIKQAIADKRRTLVLALLYKNADFFISAEEALDYAAEIAAYTAEVGDTVLLSYLHGIDVEWCAAQGANSGHIDVVKQMIKRGAKNYTDIINDARDNDHNDIVDYVSRLSKK